VDRDATVAQLDVAPFEAELERIDRRRDALAILSSFFVGDRLAERPPFSKFFLPLKVPFNHSSADTDTPVCGILGHLDGGEMQFDPLQPLETVFSSSLDTSAVTALAPLCHPLSLPRGYVHARSLMARFRHSLENNVAQPSFENDVNPVLKRIRSPSERAVLAEWCADQYQSNDVERLKCLGVVLQSSMQASTDIEQKRRRLPNDKHLEQQEVKALESVRKMNAVQDALSDTLRAKAVLQAADGVSNGAVKKLADALVCELDQHYQNDPQDTSPEAIIDFLYTTGSMLASQACLDSNACLSVAQFKQFCSIVHSSCRSIAEQHSHIDHGFRAQRFARRWLFHGDEGNSGQVVGTDTTDPQSAAAAPSTVLADIEEEDTLEFVMDLSGIQNAADNDWSGSKPAAQRDSKTNCEEESSALQDSSSRELSEKTSHRAALRIAFVMAFSEEERSTPPHQSNTKENSDSNKPGSKRPCLLSKLRTKHDSTETKVQDHSMELLSIVFAKPGLSSSLFSRWSSFDSTDTSMSINSKKEVPKTITFAMRHRALRAASILCPQEVLEKVAGDEGFLQSNNNEECSLVHCTFGAFLAKEIEELGLPLPHSDLVPLSTMNFPSYARALWRHHRDDDVVNRSKGKGRLLLLLTEMSIKCEKADTSFVQTLLEAMAKLNLSRSLLLALEHIVGNSTRSSLQELWDPLSKSIAAVARAVLSETSRLFKDGKTESEFNGQSIPITYGRLYKVAAAFCDSEQGRQQLLAFANMVIATCENNAHHPIANDVLRITKNARDRTLFCSKLPVVAIGSTD